MGSMPESQQPTVLNRLRAAREKLDAKDLAGAMAIYAASSLLFAALESLLAQKISRILSSAQVRVKERDQE